MTPNCGNVCTDPSAERFPLQPWQNLENQAERQILPLLSVGGARWPRHVPRGFVPAVGGPGSEGTLLL